jgi:hypothetical protein
MDSTDEPA